MYVRHAEYAPIKFYCSTISICIRCLAHISQHRKTSRIILLFDFPINNFYRNFSVAIYFGSFGYYRCGHLSSVSRKESWCGCNECFQFGHFIRRIPICIYVHKTQSKIQFVPKRPNLIGEVSISAPVKRETHQWSSDRRWRGMKIILSSIK